MKFKNAVINGKTEGIVIENGKIADVGGHINEGTDLNGKRVIPGLIDVHTHGCAGYDTMDGNFEPMCDFYAKHGTTSFLPTTLTASIDKIIETCNAATDFVGAEILGFHLEGPYISLKYKGAQNPEFVRKPDIDEFKRFKNVKMITVAPEVEGGQEFVKAVGGECIVSIGHSDCTYEQALEAIENGANCLTHTFNAMPPFKHREPGPIGAGFEKGIYAQLIGDLYHVRKPAVLGLIKLFGKERTVLISDSLNCAGLPDGEYTSGGLPIVLKGDVARLRDGVVAGSRTMLFECVKRVAAAGIPFDDAVYMASAAPAEMLGIKKGKIAIGYDADLLVLNDDTEIDSVIINGEIYTSVSL